MDSNTEKVVQRRDRWVAMAVQAPTEAIRAHSLFLAHLCDVDFELTKRARQQIAESKELIAKADTILRGH